LRCRWRGSWRCLRRDLRLSLVSRGNQGLRHGKYLRLSGWRCLSKLLLRCEGGSCDLLKHPDRFIDHSDLQRQSWVARKHACLLHLPVELRDRKSLSGFLGEADANRVATFSATCGNAEVERGKAASAPWKKRDLNLRVLKEYK
jgi:hypothetical protein